MVAIPLTACSKQPQSDIVPTSVTEAPSTRSKPLIAVVGTANQSPFTTAIREGMDFAANDEAVELSYFDFEAGDETSLIGQLQAAAGEQPDGVCVAPTVVSDSVLAAIRELRADEVLVHAFQHQLAQEDAVSCYIGTDHFHAGRQLATALVERLGEQSTATTVIIVATEASSNAKQRVHGFDYTMSEEHSDIELVRVDSGGDVPLAEALATAIERGSDRGIVVTFSTADTQAAAAAINSMVLSSTEVIGFGAYAGIKSHLRDGTVACTLVEDPYMMGLSTIMALASELKGESFGPFVDSKQHLITADRLEDEGSLKLLEANRR